MQAASFEDGVRAVDQGDAIARGRTWPLRLAWSVFAFDLILIVPIIVLGILNRNSPDVWKIADPVAGIGGPVYGLVGALIAARQPKNTLGWLFVLMGFFAQVGSVAAAWAVYSLETSPGLPLGAWALWINIWIGVSAMMPMFPLLFFPSGRIQHWLTRIVAGLTLLSTSWLLFCLMSGTTVPPRIPRAVRADAQSVVPGRAAR